MKIVHVTSTDPAGAVFNLVQALNQYTPHTARLITTHKIEAYDFPGDMDILCDFGEEVEALLMDADIIHLHKVNEKFAIDLRLPKSGKRKMFLIEDFLSVPNKSRRVIYHVHGHKTEREKPAEVGAEYKARNGIVLCSTPDLEEMYKPHCDARYFPNTIPVRHPHYLPRATDALTEGIDGCKKVCVMQTPTDTVLKNTHMFKIAVEAAATTEPVFFMEVYNQTKRVALAFKRMCHVLCDHLQGYYGLCSLEALSMAKPVIAGLSDYTKKAICDFFHINEADLPWVNAYSQEQLNEVVLLLVKDAAARMSLGERGRKFMTETWSDQHVAERLAEFYQSL